MAQRQAKRSTYKHLLRILWDVDSRPFSLAHWSTSTPTHAATQKMLCKRLPILEVRRNKNDFTSSAESTNYARSFILEIQKMNEVMNINAFTYADVYMSIYV